MRSILTAIVLATATVAAGASSLPAVAAPTNTCRKPGSEELRFAVGRQLASLSAAERLIAFKPPAPSGRPFRFYVTLEQRPVHRRLTLVYRSATGHRYALSQSLAGDGRARFDALAREIADRDPCGSRASTFRLADGNIALLIEAQDRRVLNFRAGKLAMQLIGPPETFSRARAVALANDLLGS